MEIEFEHLLNKRTKTTEYDNLPSSNDGTCPYCKREIPECEDEEVGYYINGKNYPIYFNYKEWGNDLGYFIEWKELQCCPYCKKEYIVCNGN